MSLVSCLVGRINTPLSSFVFNYSWALFAVDTISSCGKDSLCFKVTTWHLYLYNTNTSIFSSNKKQYISIFKNFILYITYLFNFTYPTFPHWRLSHPPPTFNIPNFLSSFLLLLLITHWVQLVLLIHTWWWDLPLECGQAIRIHTINKNWLSLP